MPKREVYYFGRGSSDCLAAAYAPGERVEFFVGNGKTRERGKGMAILQCQLPELVKFFEAMRDGTMHDFIEERAYPGVSVESYIEYEETELAVYPPKRKLVKNERDENG